MQFPDGYTCHHRRNFDLGETPWSSCCC
jgi:hypothetical protein